MGRKNRIKAVREFLEKSRELTLGKMNQEINTRNFLRAEIYNRTIDDIINVAIELCEKEPGKE